MPRYIVERTFPDGLDIPSNADGAGTCPVDRITQVRVLDPYFYI